jgi:hypothetical protein
MRAACSRPRTLARPLSDWCGRGAVQEEKAEQIRKSWGNQNRKTFTDADDKCIRQLVKKLGTQWTAIGKAIGRPRNTVETRWVNYLRPECKLKKDTGNWTAGEDEQLISAVSAHQTDFVHIEVRSSYSCALPRFTMSLRSISLCRNCLSLRATETI